MAAKRRLIVNADDLGQSAGVSRGILEAHEKGIVTSASLMVRWPAAATAALDARRTSLSIGLHLDFGEWTLRNGQWEARYEVVPLIEPDAVRKEAYRQLQQFRDLVGRDPTHLDSHQHVHKQGPAREVAAGIGSELGIPVRHFGSIHYCGDFYGQAEDGSTCPEILCVAGLTKILAKLQPGTTELACHPGYADDLPTMYARERAMEIQVLCDPEVRDYLRSVGIELCSFRDNG